MGAGASRASDRATWALVSERKTTVQPLWFAGHCFSCCCCWDGGGFCTGGGGAAGGVGCAAAVGTGVVCTA